YGAYDHDQLRGQLAGLSPFEVKKIRKIFAQSSTDQPLILRHILKDAARLPQKEFENYIQDVYTPLRESFAGTVPVYIGPYTQGQYPLQVPGQSVVFHHKSYHGKNILGKYNPALINPNIIAVMNNKYFEYTLWNKYVPGAIPHSVLLKD